MLPRAVRCQAELVLGFHGYLEEMSGRAADRRLAPPGESEGCAGGGRLVPGLVPVKMLVAEVLGFGLVQSDSAFFPPEQRPGTSREGYLLQCCH